MRGSSIETHVGSSDSVVRVSSSTQQPGSHSSAFPLSREEVVEDGGVERSEGSLSVIIIVSFDLRTDLIV